MKPEPLFSVERLRELVEDARRTRDLRRCKGDTRQAEAAEEKRRHFEKLLENARMGRVGA